MESLDNYINFQQPTLYYALANIMFNPIFWNVAARVEYRSRAITQLAGNNALRACTGFAATIFSLGILRDYLYVQAIELQPILPILESNVFKVIAVGLFLAGNVLVMSSMWALGVTGTYLGDYFGILKDARVTGFPFNVCENPMYTGCTLSFLGTALWYASPTGLLLTLAVHVVYRIALRFEGPCCWFVNFSSDILLRSGSDNSENFLMGDIIKFFCWIIATIATITIIHLPFTAMIYSTKDI